MKLNLSQFINKNQLQILRDFCKDEEAEYFTLKINDIKQIIATMPKTYETDGQGLDAVAYLHYFTGGADWYITERDAGCENPDGSWDASQLQAFGAADLGYGAELGYISIEEIVKYGAELDLYFTPKPLKEITGERSA